jgi:hypothetical protein
MEVFGVPVNGPNLAIAGAAGYAFWDFIGSKVPWKSLLAKAWALITRKKTAPRVADRVSADTFEQITGMSKPDHGADFMYAMRDLHRLAHSPEEHARLGQFTADWWSAEPKETTATETAK